MDSCNPRTEQTAEPPWPPGDPDLPLVQALARGEAPALAILYARHGPAVLAYLVGLLGERAVAEEVLQDVMLADWHGARAFRGASTVRTWLLAIARRRAGQARRRKALPQVSLDAAAALAAPEPPDRLEQAATQARVRHALAQLPAEQRETLELIFYHELSGPEAAGVLGVALGTVKSRLFRARTRLKTLLTREDAADA